MILPGIPNTDRLFLRFITLGYAIQPEAR